MQGTARKLVSLLSNLMNDAVICLDILNKYVFINDNQQEMCTSTEFIEAALKAFEITEKNIFDKS